jgi:hypothetical protein
MRKIYANSTRTALTDERKVMQLTKELQRPNKNERGGTTNKGTVPATQRAM